MPSAPSRLGSERKWKYYSLSRVGLFETPWAAAHQAPLSMGFSRQEYWSGLPCPPPGGLPNPGIEPGSPALQADSFPSEPPGKPPQGWGVDPKRLSLSCSQRTLSSCITPLLPSLTLCIHYMLSLCSLPPCKHCLSLTSMLLSNLSSSLPSAGILISLSRLSMGFASSWEPSLTPPALSLVCS